MKTYTRILLWLIDKMLPREYTRPRKRPTPKTDYRDRLMELCGD